MGVAEIIKQIIGYKEFHFELATVNNTDPNKRVCEVKMIKDDSVLTDVRLQALKSENTGIFLIPEDGSDVIIGFLEDSEAFIMQYSKLKNIEIKTTEKIILNGDSFGGLIKINELKKGLENEVKRVDVILTALMNAIPATGAPDSGAALIASIKASLSKIPFAAKYDNIENEKVSHG